MPPHGETGSAYGEDILGFTQGFHEHIGSAHDAARHVLTHAGRYPLGLGINSLALFDRAVYELLQEHRYIPLTPRPPMKSCQIPFRMYVNSLGRLHIRQAAEQTISYGTDESVVDVGWFGLELALSREAQDRFDSLMAIERRQFARLRRAMDEETEAGNLANILEEVIDHVEHVESVCFYVGDRFYARMERLVNLVQGKGSTGFLNGLRGKGYVEWTSDAILIAAALHALFLAGKAVQFEEFNGVSLTATAVWDKLEGLSRAYSEAGAPRASADDGLFRFARDVRSQSLQSIGASWLRYRWIYGINFQKVERILPAPRSTESPLAAVMEFAKEYVALVGAAPDERYSEGALFTSLAEAALDRDLNGIACQRSSPAVTSWVEHLVQEIVASAVKATSSDYGMSSSQWRTGYLLRSISRSAARYSRVTHVK